MNSPSLRRMPVRVAEIPQAPKVLHPAAGAEGPSDRAAVVRGAAVAAHVRGVRLKQFRLPVLRQAVPSRPYPVASLGRAAGGVRPLRARMLV